MTLAARCGVVALLMSLCAGGSRAGDLDPPVGPVAPTPGPEPRTPVNATNTPGDATSVYRITAPGSYYLTGNLAGVAGKHGRCPSEGQTSRPAKNTCYAAYQHQLKTGVVGTPPKS